MAQAGQNVGLLSQATGLQQGLAALQPQLASQNIGLIGQIGAQQQAQAQAIADTQARANQMIALMPQQRLGFFGSTINRNWVEVIQLCHNTLLNRLVVDQVH